MSIRYLFMENESSFIVVNSILIGMFYLPQYPQANSSRFTQWQEDQFVNFQQTPST